MKQVSDDVSRNDAITSDTQKHVLIPKGKAFGRNVLKVSPTLQFLLCDEKKTKFQVLTKTIGTLLRRRNIKFLDANGKHKTISVDTKKMVEMGYLTKEQSLSLGLLPTKTLRGERFAKILQEVDQKLESTKPQEGESQESWVNRIKKDFVIEPNKIKPLQVIPIKVRPEQISYYFELQKHIAKLIPEEFKRPVFDLHIVGTNIEDNMSHCQLGILGGVGSLSDANIIMETVSKLKESKEGIDNIAINLFSCPPPRSKKDLLKYGKEYLKKVACFGARQHVNYALASNTAHLYLRAIRRLTGLTPIHNSVLDVISHIKHGEHTPEHILVLSTSRVYKRKMYSSALAKEKLKALTPSLNDQNIVQDIIDSTKQNGFEVSNKDALIELIKKQVKLLHSGKKISHILLGCTELPLALGLEGMREIENKLGVKIVDTEHIFADVFAKLAQGKTMNT